jgi:DNA-binding NarL/FixJ family response regulator
MQEADFEQLTNVELEVLSLLSKGLSNGDIADTLGVDKDSVAKYIWKMRKKLPPFDRSAMVDIAEKLEKYKERTMRHEIQSRHYTAISRQNI